MQVGDLLQEKGMAVHVVSDTLTVRDAVRLMGEWKTSALIVTRGDRPSGIFTERDIYRCHRFHGEGAISDLRIEQVMTHKLIMVQAGDQIHHAVSSMLQADIRHLPVLQEGKIIGLLGLRDLVQHYIASLTAELEHLHEYIADLQEAGRD